MVDEKGTQVARIAYNGRIFQNESGEAKPPAVLQSMGLTEKLKPNTLYILSGHWEGTQRTSGVAEQPYSGDPVKAYENFRAGNPNATPQAIVATDENGTPSKVISPNGARVHDFNSAEGRYTLGDVDAYRKDAQRRIEEGRRENNPDKVNAAIEERVSALRADIAERERGQEQHRKEYEAALAKQKAGTPIASVDQRFDSWKEYLANSRRIGQALESNLQEMRNELASWESQRVREVGGVESEARAAGQAPGAAGTGAETAVQPPAPAAAATPAPKRPVEESVQERTEREWTENWSRVTGEPDLTKISTTDLERALGFGSHAIAAQSQKSSEGGEVNRDLVNSIAREMDGIKAELRRRGAIGAPTKPVTILGKTPDKLTKRELETAAKGARKPAQREAAAAELQRRSEAAAARGQRQGGSGFLSAIKKAGGIDPAFAAEVGGDTGLQLNRRMPGLIRKGGLTEDGLLEWARSNAYLTDAEVEQADRSGAGGGMELAKGLVRKAIAGEEVHPLGDLDQVYARQAEEQARRAAEDHEYRMKTDPEYRAQEEAAQAALKSEIAASGLHPAEAEAVQQAVDTHHAPPDWNKLSADEQEAELDAIFGPAKSVAAGEGARAQAPQAEVRPSGEGALQRQPGEDDDVTPPAAAAATDTSLAKTSGMGPDQAPSTQTPERPSGDTDATLARFRPRGLVKFKKPYVGKTGAKLIGYEWKYEVIDIVDNRGEDRKIRVSDWADSITNPATNREIVHHFQVETPDGRTELVSAETAAKMLGVSDSTARAAAKRSLEDEIRQARERERLEDHKAELERAPWYATPAAAVDGLIPGLRKVWSRYRSWGEDKRLSQDRKADDGDRYAAENRFKHAERVKIWFTKGPKGYIAIEEAADPARGWERVELTPMQIWDENGNDADSSRRPSFELSAPTKADLEAKERQAREGDVEERSAALRDRDDAILTPPTGTAPPRDVAEQKVPTSQQNLFSTAASALREAADKIEKAAAPEKKPAPKAEPKQEGKLTDVGENLWYNRRNFTGKATTWDDVKGLNDALKVKEVVKTKVWPKPDYEQLVAEGLEPFFARMIKKVYDGIATSPAGKSDEDLQRYITVVGRVRDAVFDWAKDNNANQEFIGEIARQAKTRLEKRFSIMELSDKVNIRDVIIDRVWPVSGAEERTRNYRFSGNSERTAEARAIGGNRALQAMQFSIDDAVEAMKDIEKGWPKSQEAWQRQGYQIVKGADIKVEYHEGKRTRDQSPYVSVSWGMPGNQYLQNMTIDGATSKDDQAVQEVVKAESEKLSKGWLVLDKRRRVVKTAESEEAAKEAARELVKREGGKGGDIRGMNISQAERTGEARRKEGENVTPQRLMDEFGFRGVNFGREGWINQSERQAYLNHAYDGLLDLAELLDVPPKALSLNGMLGIAFGAQGRGGHAAAHFVPGVNEINLTKTMGAGTLAHEWGHALDHYFATQAGLSKSNEPYMSAHATMGETRAKLDQYGRKVGTEARFGELRAEIIAAFKEVVETMEKRPMSEAEFQAREEASKNRALKQLESWLQHFRKDIERVDASKLPEFDKLAERLRKGDTGEFGVKVGQQYLSDVVGQIKALVKGMKGASTDIASNWKGLESNASHVRYLLAEKQATKTHEPQKPETTSTAYAGESSRKDQEKKGKPYWRTRWEMFARAFETWVGSRLEEQARSNTFLSDALIRAESRDREGGYAMPYPRGEDRTRINAAMVKLVDAIETKETDKGVAMFARSNVTEEQARERGFTLKAYRGVERGKPFNDSGTVWATTNRDVAEAYVRDVWGFDDGEVVTVMVKPEGIPVRDIRKMSETELKEASPDEFGNPQAIGIYRNSDDSPLGSNHPHTAIHVPAENMVEVRGAEPKLARAGKPAAGLTRSAMRDAVAKAFGEKAADKLLGEVLVAVDRQDELPEHVVPLLRKGDVVYGFYDPRTDKAYAVLENLATEDIRGLVMHEVGVHYGFERMLGEDKYKQVLRRLEVMRKGGNKAVQEAHEKARRDAAKPEHVPEETLAWLVTNRPELSLVREVIAAIKAFLFRQFGILGDSLTEDDMAALARAAVLRAGGPEQIAELAPAFHRAFHGSPHDFDRFSTHKIGTGEGAQAYGWGLYFAGRREVAEYYRHSLAKAQFFLDGKPLNEGASVVDQEHWQLASALMHMGKVADLDNVPAAIDKEVKALREHARFAEKNYGEATASMYLTRADLLEKYRDRVTARRGRLYEVELAPREDEYLDRDKPMAKQSATVLARLKEAGLYDPTPEWKKHQTVTAWEYIKDGVPLATISVNGDDYVVRWRDAAHVEWRSSLEEAKRTAEARVPEDLGVSGREFYESLARQFERDDALWQEIGITPESRSGAYTYTGTAEAASRYLAKHGIPGLKYLDGSSRTRGEGHHNYVIFDDSHVSIEAKFARSRAAWIDQQPADTQEALRKAGVWYAPPTMKDRIAEWKKDWAKRVTQGLVDQFAPIKDYDYKAYMLARMTRGGDAALEALLHYGTIKLDAEGAVDVDFQSGGFLKILQDLKGEHDRFFAWVVGNRAERLKAEDRENNFTDADIRNLKALAGGQMKDGSSRTQTYARVKGELDRYNKAVLDVAERAGLIESSSRSAWEKDFYVPFYRLMEDESDQGRPIPQMTRGLVNQYAFKVLKGGEQALGDPLENVLKNWSHLIDASLKNQAAKASLTAAARVGAVIEADETTARQMAKSIGNKRGAVSFLDDGKARWFVVEDPFLLDALRSIGFTGFGGAGMKVMGQFKKWLTMGVTVSPTFRIRNVIRDSMQMIGANPASYNVLANVLTGWNATKEGSPEFASILAGGGVMRFGSVLEGDRAEHVKRLIEAGVEDDTILNTPAKAKAMLTAAWDWWQHIGDRAENVNRAALYKKLRAEGRTHLEASFAARDTMDFSMQGTWGAVRFLVQTVPFMNARLQGLYKLGRGAAEDPRRFGIVVGGAALASMALLLAYKDDDDWKEREDWDRETFWWFKIGNKAFRIPKPFEIGAIATIAERGLELMATDELTGKQFADRVFSIISDQLSLNPVPQLAKPIAEVWANRNTFTDRPIELMGMERLSPAQRVAPGTSATAQLLGKNNVVSPVQIDHLVRGYFGWLGAHIVATADLALRPVMGLPPQPAYKIDDVLVVGDFVRDLPQYQSKYVTRLYQQMKEVQEAMADLRHLQKIGATEEAAKLLEEKRDKIGLYRLYTHAERHLSNVNQQIKLVQQRPGDPEEKRARLDALYAQRNRIARLTEEAARQRAR